MQVNANAAVSPQSLVLAPGVTPAGYKLTFTPQGGSPSVFNSSSPAFSFDSPPGPLTVQCARVDTMGNIIGSPVSAQIEVPTPPVIVNIPTTLTLTLG